VLNLLGNGAEEIWAVDVNPSQSHLLELKTTAIRRFEYDDYLQLLGVRPSERLVAGRTHHGVARAQAVKQGTALPIEKTSAVQPAELRGVLIGIYMFPWSVHVNRAPVCGKVTSVQPQPAVRENRSMVRALMHLAWDLPVIDQVRASVADNARNTLVIDGELCAAVVQIADRYVREIDCFVRVGETVERGQRIGMIRMGSQCDVFVRRIPTLDVLCRPGDRVRAGETVLARY
jgi:phosphatidylserine decarboxylase